MLEARSVYRFVHVASADDPALETDFRSDREAGKRPFPREKTYPELRDGMSTFGSLEAARARWQEMNLIASERGQEVRAGNFIAEVRLQPDLGFQLEDLGEPDEHLTLWGDKARLVEATRQIYPASTSNP